MLPLGPGCLAGQVSGGVDAEDGAVGAPQATRVSHTAGSSAVDGDGEGAADLPHPFVAEPSEPVDEHAERHALHRVEVDRAHLRDGIHLRFEDHFTRKVADRRRARSDEGSTESGDRDVAAEHDDGSATDVGQLAPPELAPARLVAHDEPAAVRNEARSPHSSGSSRGRSSYAA